MGTGKFMQRSHRWLTAYGRSVCLWTNILNKNWPHAFLFHIKTHDSRRRIKNTRGVERLANKKKILRSVIHKNLIKSIKDSRPTNMSKRGVKFNGKAEACHI